MKIFPIRNLLQRVSRPIPALNRVEGRRIQKVSVLLQACNLTCPMCSMNVNNTDVGQILRDYDGATRGPQLTLSEYKIFFDSIAHHRPQVSFGGGEPTIFPYLADLVEYISVEHEMGVGVTTNGTLFSDDSRERLARYAGSITVSIDGLEGTHDSIRGSGNFGVSTSELRKLVIQKRNGDAKALISSLFCLHENNWRELEDVATYLLNDVQVDHLTVSNLIFSRRETIAANDTWRLHRGLSDIYRIALTRGGDSSFADFSLMNFEAIWDVKCRLKTRHKNIRFEPDFHSIEDMRQYFLTDNLLPRYFGDSCQPSTTTLTLISNGDVLFFPQCFQIMLGNIRELDPQEIWNSDRFEQIRKDLSGDLSPVCAHCCANRVEKHYHLDE